MPDIGLLQGPPRPAQLTVTRATPDAPVVPPRIPEPEAVIALADEARAIRIEVVPEPVVSAAVEEPAARPAELADADALPARATSPVAVTSRMMHAAVSGTAAHAAAVAHDAPIAMLRDESPHGASHEASHVALDEPLAPQPAAAADESVLVAAETPPASVAASTQAPIPAASVVVPIDGRKTPAPPQPDYPVPPLNTRDLLWLLLALALIVATGLGIRDPWPADEPRFASLARDMVQSGEWLFPRVGGDLYQDKPPLFFWMLAVCYTLFGAFRGWFLLPALLAAAGVLFLIYDFGRRTVGREAGLAAAVAVCCSLQFVLAFRGAQIDPVLCLLTTFSLYAFLRHLLLGDGWRWYALGGFAAGLGVFTKGVGFLPLLVLVPFFTLRGLGWKGLHDVDAGRGGWRWWLAPAAMLAAIALWFVPMLLAVESNGSPEYLAYRDEILFKQTVGRYAAAWHHVKGWSYFLVEVIPPLWLPWSLLLFWLVPRFKAAFHERDARVWLPLSWVLLVVLFFSMSPGKRGVYILPALPALAIAALPVLPGVLARRGVLIAGWVLALGFWVAGLVTLILVELDLLEFATNAGIGTRAIEHMLIAFLVLGAAGLLGARARAPLAAWPAALAALCIAFSYWLAPRMNGERSGKDFVHTVLTQVQPGEELALVAYKEQFLLYLDRPTFNFGHRRWQEGPQEYFDAAAWLNAREGRVLLVPEEALAPKDRFKPTQPAIPCFKAHATKAGTSSGDEWYLVRAPAERACAALGDASRAIPYRSPASDRRRSPRQG
jgi:4-amino-4-deoxy-L-arabinose transferase-like glycosyltransferase